MQVSASGGEDVFVHYSSIRSDGFRSLNEEQRVEFRHRGWPEGPAGEQRTLDLIVELLASGL